MSTRKSALERHIPSTNHINILGLTPCDRLPVILLKTRNRQAPTQAHAVCHLITASKRHDELGTQPLAHPISRP
jgi:hypothetical protein